MPVVALLAQHAAAAHQSHSLVLDLLAILAAAALVSLALRRLHLATTPGFLLTGALLGLLVELTGGRIGVLTDPESIESITALATILLMFTIGLHMDLDSIRSGLVHILLVGVVATVGVVLIGWPVAKLFGLSMPAALAVAMALSMSSTAVVLRLLQQRRESHRTHGRIIFGVLIVQDMLVLVFLALLPPLAEWAGAGMTGAVGELEEATPGPKLLKLVSAAALGLGGIATMIVLGRYVLPRLLREAAKDSSTDAMLVLSAAVALGAAVGASALGFSPELGAFLAGFLLAATPFRVQLAGQLAPVRDLFMALFFTAIGLRMNIPEVLGDWWIVLLGLVALIAVKAAVNAAACWAFGATADIAAVSGLALAQGGEFSLVILAGAAGLHIVSPQATADVIAVVVLSLMLTPVVFDLAARLRPRLSGLRTAPWIAAPTLRDTAHHEAAASAGALPAAEALAANGKPATRVIIAGFGVVGRALADQFEVAKVPFTVIELNPGTVRRQSKLGRSTVYGDVANPEVLEAAGIHHADAVVITIPDDDAVLKACQAIRTLNPATFIAVRTGYLSSAFRATSVGADHVTVAEVATAEAMARQVMQQLRTRGHIADPEPARAAT